MTISIDFDGVIHRYSRGWADGTIYDPPIPGALAGVRTLLDQDAVFILTSREPEQVMPWLERYGVDVTTDDRCRTCLGTGREPHLVRSLQAGREGRCEDCSGSGLLTFWNLRGQLLVTTRKLPARLYVDDRAVRFVTWDQSLRDIAHYTAP